MEKQNVILNTLHNLQANYLTKLHNDELFQHCVKHYDTLSSELDYWLTRDYTFRCNQINLWQEIIKPIENSVYFCLDILRKSSEIKGSEWKFGTGYTWKKLKLPIKLAGNPIEPSDLRMRLDVAVRDNKTITRKIVENQNLPTAGQRAVTIQFSGDYNLTKQLMLRLYFDRRVNTPFISTSFPTANTNGGFALRFQLR